MILETLTVLFEGSGVSKMCEQVKLRDTLLVELLVLSRGNSLALPGPLVRGPEVARQLTETERNQLMLPTEGALGSRPARL